MIVATSEKCQSIKRDDVDKAQNLTENKLLKLVANSTNLAQMTLLVGGAGEI